MLIFPIYCLMAVSGFGCKAPLMANSRIVGSYGVDAPYVPIVSGVSGSTLVMYGFVQPGLWRWITLALTLALFLQVIS